MIFNEIFGNYLIHKKIAKTSVIKQYIKRSIDNSSPLFIELVKDGLLPEDKVYNALASFLKLEFKVCQLTELDLELIKSFSKEKIIEYRTVPFKVSQKEIQLLISNPFKIEEIKEFTYLGYSEFKFILVTPTNLERLISFIDNKLEQSNVLNDFKENKKDLTVSEDDGIKVDAPVVKFCDSVLKDAVNRMASDIHIEPGEENFTIRYRIDGDLMKMNVLPIGGYAAVLARFKIMSELNIAERRVPQDGKINLTINELDYDFRVSTIPTIFGEKIVIRIYNVNFKNNDLKSLGFNDEQEILIKSMITRPHGIILLTGPTGSGKSTTLYSFLRYLNSEKRNIITVEDPVENIIAGINQVQVNTKANLTFATALRSILRQDPNIIMIGEIRDEETAQIATRAALTGHLVLSTIHTNDAAGVVPRLINMGIPRYLVSDSLLGAISQRLIRKVCPKCKRRHKVNHYEQELLNVPEDTYIYSAKGCPYCNHTGYFGRTAVFEIMVLDDEVRDFIMSDDFNSDRLNDILATKTHFILEHVKERILNGETTVEEYDKLSDIVDIN